MISEDKAKEKLKKLAKEVNVDLNDKQLKMFIKYYNLLIEKNKVMNLTAITDLDEVIVKHFVDSLAIANFIDMTQEMNVIDVGSGAGFPGIPLKIAFPNINLVMLDSLGKRVNFLNDTTIRLGLTNVDAIHARAEDGARIKGMRQNFDLCVSRAVANLATLSEYCLPFVKEGGDFVCYKSGNVEVELKDSEKAITTLSSEVKGMSRFILPETDIERTLIKITVKGKIDKKYPRKSGIPGRDPIK